AFAERDTCFRRKEHLLSPKGILAFAERNICFRRKEDLLSPKAEHKPNARTTINLTQGPPST
ncbi:MAG: hypothetical protein IJ269_07105, partial [Bacteroidales bacterium]|nr:hypothetical protein [Bacteroidales bacterium]